MRGVSMREARYGRCLVAYVDILGFREIVLRETTKDSGAGQVRKELKFAQRVGRIPKRKAESFGEYRFKSFLDSVSMSVPVSHGCLSFFLLHVHRFQRELANHGIFVRGAVVVGEHFENTSVLFGPALIQAVELEKTVSLWPRVVVHPNMIDLFGESGLWLDPKKPEQEFVQSLHLLRSDYDGISYIDYLRHYLCHFQEYGDSLKEAETLASNHRSQIIEKVNVNKSRLRVFAKYHWLAAYHNIVMAELNWRHLAISPSELVSRL